MAATIKQDLTKHSGLTNASNDLRELFDRPACYQARSLFSFKSKAPIITSASIAHEAHQILDSIKSYTARR